MKKLYVNELQQHLNEKITFEGFVDTIRDKKWVMFVILRDSKGKVQKNLAPEDAKNIVFDVLLLMEKIKDNVKSLWFFRYTI